MNLVLSSFGAQLTAKNGVFQVQTAEASQSVNPADVRTITVSKSARISSEAVLLAIANEVDILFVDGTGQPKGRVWSVQYGSVSTIRKGQLEFLYSEKCIPWVKELILQKINNQIALILAFRDEITDETDRRRIQGIISGMDDYRSKISKAEGTVISEVAPSLRGWEGAAGRRYFEALNYFLPSSFQFPARSAHPATDPFNALLNYGYGILYGKVEGALIKAGIDPYVGIFHRDEYNRPALVFDVIERYRMWIDYVVVSLARQEVLDEECFQTDDRGAVLLQGLGKRILIQSVNDYLSEVVSIGRLTRSREVHMEQDAHSLAKTFQNALP